MTALPAAWILFCLALPLTIAGANAGWVLILLALIAERGRVKIAEARTPLVAPVTFYCLVALAACAFSMEPSLSFPMMHKDLHKLWLCLLLPVGLSALPADSDSHLFRALTVGLAAAAAIGIGQALHGRLIQGYWARAHAFVHPVSFGEILAMGVLGGVCIVAAPANLSRSAKISWGRSTILLFIVWTSGALLLSQTRGAILGLAAGLAAIGLSVAGLRLLFLGGSAVALAGAAAADLLEPAGMGRSILRTSSSFSGPNFARLTLWHGAWDMFLKHPWLGVGPGDFRTQITQFYPGRIDGEYNMGSAHNLFLHQLAERGILGLAALLVLFWVLWRRSFARVKANPETLNLWAFSATVAFTVMNLTETALQTEQVWMLFFLIWLWSEKRQQTWEHGK